MISRLCVYDRGVVAIPFEVGQVSTLKAEIGFLFDLYEESQSLFEVGQVSNEKRCVVVQTDPQLLLSQSLLK